MPVLFATALMVTACGTASNEGESGGDPGVNNDDLQNRNPDAVLQYGINQVESLDPIREVSACEVSALSTIFDTLIVLDNEGAPEPGLATSWDLTDDVFRLELREDVVFQDGTEFNAEAVEFNLKRVMDDEASSFSSELFQVSDIEVIDDYTIDLTLDPIAPGSLPAALSGRAGMMASPTAVRAAESSEEFSKEPVGSGMYEVDGAWSPRESLSVRSWEGYWDEDAQALGGIDFKLVEPSAVVGTLQAGDIDLAPVSPPEVELVESTAGVEVLTEPLNQMRLFIINETLDPWQDLEVRQALNHSIDQRTLTEALTNGTGEPALGGYFPENHWAHNPDLTDYYEYDPELSREILTDAGYELPVKFKAHVGQGKTDYIRMGEAISDMLAEGGFEMELWLSGEGMSQPLLYSEGPEGTGSSEASPLAAPGYDDPDTWFRERMLDDGASNAGANEEPGMRDLLDAGVKEVERDARAGYYLEAQELAVENALDSVPLWFVSMTMAHRDVVSNYSETKGSCDENFRGVFMTNE